MFVEGFRSRWIDTLKKLAGNVLSLADSICFIFFVFAGWILVCQQVCRSSSSRPASQTCFLFSSWSSSPSATNKAVTTSNMCLPRYRLIWRPPPPQPRPHLWTLQQPPLGTFCNRLVVVPWYSSFGHTLSCHRRIRNLVQNGPQWRRAVVLWALLP